MENCLFTKLRGSASNPNLPVFKNVVFKSWIKTTVANQYINLLSAARETTSLRLSIIEVTFKLESTAGNNTYVYDCYSSSPRLVYLNTGNINARITDTAVDVPCSKEVSHTTVLNLYDRTFQFDGGTPQVVTETATSTSNYRLFNLFADRNGANAQAGKILIGNVKFKKIKSDDTADVVVDLVPALVDDVPCLYDRISENTYFAADGNALEVL